MTALRAELPPTRPHAHTLHLVCRSISSTMVGVAWFGDRATRAKAAALQFRTSSVDGFFSAPAESRKAQTFVSIVELEH